MQMAEQLLSEEGMEECLDGSMISAGCVELLNSCIWAWVGDELGEGGINAFPGVRREEAAM